MNATAQLLRDAAAEFPPVSTEVATTLPVRAEVAYEVFADAGETPRWLSVVQSARVLERDDDGRPAQVAFRASFDRATLGYVVRYEYRAAELTIRWSTTSGSAIRVEGEARFTPLSDRACLMTYRLGLELPVSREWIEAHYDGHAASAVVGDFREHLRRFV
ncbi:MAG: SRPBCC family protein [Myxococcales bacterium]|nr:SRPBCC family protein [Myxococcales bacterium]